MDVNFLVCLLQKKKKTGLDKAKSNI